MFTNVHAQPGYKCNLILFSYSGNRMDGCYLYTIIWNGLEVGLF